MRPKTQRQDEIYNYLLEKKTAQSAYDILDAFRDHGIRAPSQIYRELNKLIESGLIHKVESLNAYIACRQKHDIGQSFLAICSNCGSIKEISGSKLAKLFQSFNDWGDFIPQELKVEVKGRCSGCS